MLEDSGEQLDAQDGAVTFNEQGRLIGSYALGGPTEDQMTYSVFQACAAHSVFKAAVEQLTDSALRPSLTETLSR